MKHKNISVEAYGDSFDDAVELFTNHGFTIVHNEDFLDENHGQRDTLLLMWRKGILLMCESLEGHRLGAAVMHYNWRPNSSTNGMKRFLDEGAFVNVDGGRKMLSGSHDVREGFVNILSSLDENGTFLTTWLSAPKLHITNYIENFENTGGDLKEILWDKIDSLPGEVRESLKILL